MNIHACIIKAINSLQYSSDKQGFCHGITLRWLEACLLNEEGLFAERLKKIEFCGDKLSSQIAQVKAKPAKSLTANDLALLDIMAFLESVVIYQDTVNHTDLFSKGHGLSQNDFDVISEYASCDKIQAQGGLSRLHTQDIIVTKKELTAYLNQLKGSIETSSIKAPFGILVVTADHVMAISYHKAKGWRFIDINEYSCDNFNPVTTEEMVGLLENYFGKSSDKNQHFFAATMSIISTKTSVNEAQKVQLMKELEPLDKPLTEELAQRVADDVGLLYLAARCGNLSLVTELIAFGADLNKDTLDGVTPVHIAAQGGYAAVIEVLAQRGADLNKMRHNGVTPAHIAAKNGDAAVIEVLAQYGADLNKAMPDGATLAFIAAENGDVAVIEVLAQYGADLNKAMPERATPVFIAAQNGDVAVIDALAKHKVDLNKAMQDGATPVLIAAQNGDVAVIEVLAQHGADLNKAMQDGVTPVLIAANKGDVAVIEVLEKHGADLNKATHNGATPAFIAAQNGHMAVVAELIKRKVDFTKPFSATPQGLITFSQNHPVSVQGRMQQFINNQGAGNPKILMKPRDIAHVMGHSEIVKLLDEHEIKIKKEQEQVFKGLLESMEDFLHSMGITSEEYPSQGDDASSLREKIFIPFKEKGEHFYKAPSAQTLAAFKGCCDWEGVKTQLRGYSKEWESLHYIIKGILGLFAALSVIPGLVVAATTRQGYWGTFFSPVPIPAVKAIEEIKVPFERSIKALESVLAP